MSAGFWAGSVPPWAAVVGFCACVLFLFAGLWVGAGRKDRAYDEGYEDGQGDMRDEYAAQQAGRLVASQARTAALLAVAVRGPEPPGLTAVREAGYAVWDRRAELWARQAEDPGEWAVPLEYPPAETCPALGCDGECAQTTCPAASNMGPRVRDAELAVKRSAGHPAYEPAWEPWSLSEGTTVEEEVRAMIANANAAPSVRWLASLELVTVTPSP
jgi:hypothetical protein